MFNCRYRLASYSVDIMSEYSNNHLPYAPISVELLQFIFIRAPYSLPKRQEQLIPKRITSFILPAVKI